MSMQAGWHCRHFLQGPWIAAQDPAHQAANLMQQGLAQSPCTLHLHPFLWQINVAGTAHARRQ